MRTKRSMTRKRRTKKTKKKTKTRKKTSETSSRKENRHLYCRERAQDGRLLPEAATGAPQKSMEPPNEISSLAAAWLSPVGVCVLVSLYPPPLLITATGPGNILTVADDLLKNDGQKFLEMMEQLAERRMQREEEASADVEDDSEDDSDMSDGEGDELGDGDEGEGSEGEGDEDEDEDDEDDEDEEEVYVGFCSFMRKETAYTHSSLT